MGEWVLEDGQRYDIQLKGAGSTPYSRAVMAYHPLACGEGTFGGDVPSWVPTTRALAAVATGDSVFRNDREPGAVMVALPTVTTLRYQYFAMTPDGRDYPTG